jgi:hypothetical protein
VQKFKAWMMLSDTAAKKKLAAAANLPMTYLYALLSGKRIASPELAARIEKASGKINKKSSNYPSLDRGDLSPVCGACEFYKKCKK